MQYPVGTAVAGVWGPLHLWGTHGALVAGLRGPLPLRGTHRSLLWQGYGMACVCAAGPTASCPVCTRMMALSIMSCNGTKT